MLGVRFNFAVMLLVCCQCYSVLSFASDKATSQTTTLLYFSRPPYFVVSDNGQVGGFLYERSKMAVDNAGLSGAVQWLNFEETWQSVLAYLKRPQPACFVGGYYTEERAKHYKYSNAFYQEPGYVVVASPKVSKALGNRVSIETLLRSNFVLGQIEGFSYGPALDKLIEDLHPASVQTRYTLAHQNGLAYRNIFELMSKGRFDYYFISSVEADFYLDNADFGSMGLSYVNLEKRLPENGRYFICSTSVDDSVINKINRAIAKQKQ